MWLQFTKLNKEKPNNVPCFSIPNLEGRQHPSTWGSWSSLLPQFQDSSNTSKITIVKNSQRIEDFFSLLSFQSVLHNNCDKKHQEHCQQEWSTNNNSNKNVPGGIQDREEVYVHIYEGELDQEIE
jgi:hypothetical protein